jgi:hypothetical protein
MKAYRARKKAGSSALRLVVFLLNCGWRSRSIREVISRLELSGTSKPVSEPEKYDPRITPFGDCYSMSKPEGRPRWKETCGLWVFRDHRYPQPLKAHGREWGALRFPPIHYQMTSTSPTGERPLKLQDGVGIPLFSFGEGKRSRNKRHHSLKDTAHAFLLARQEFDPKMCLRQEDRDVVLPRMVDPINLVHADRTRIVELAALRDERLRRHGELWEVKPEVVHINLRKLDGKLRSKTA